MGAGVVVRDRSAPRGSERGGRPLRAAPGLRPPAAGGGDVTEPLASTTFH